MRAFLSRKISIVTNASGIIHKARVSFYQSGNAQCLRPIGVSGTDHRRSIMNGYCGPGAKLLLAHLKEMSYRWKYKQCYSIQNEYNAQRYRHLLLIGVQHRTHCGNCASSANSCPRRDKICRFAIDMHPVAEHTPKHHHTYHRYNRKQHTLATST